MKASLKALPYIAINIVVFYLLPMIIKDTGSAIIVMLMIIPVACFFTAFIFGMNHSFQWSYPVIIALLFAPTIFIFYNPTAWVYIIAYGLIAAIGNLIGKLFFKSIK